ncbi:MAG: type IX secretion system sortase PorU [Bacteroidetes bacterium]|nr:type IX secretion system sortase PorU [Bacteroidota bacterium]
MIKQLTFPRLVILILAFVFPTLRAGSQTPNTFATSSVLATGKWYKFSVSADGIYRLTYTDLKNAGVPVASLNPKNLRIYGNGGGMLPESNDSSRVDDLIENPIFVYGQDDGVFNEGDYILFYGSGPDRWKFNKSDNLFHHIKNIYSDVSCYFLNCDLGEGMRIQTQAFIQAPANATYTNFNDFIAYDRDEINLIQSGRVWYDKETFDVVNSRNYSFTFPNFDSRSPMTITLNAASRSLGVSSYFNVNADGKLLMSLSIDPVSTTFEDYYAHEGVISKAYTTANQTVNLNLIYNPMVSGAIGWLNYFEINALRLLNMNGSQMNFRNASSWKNNWLSEFQVSSQGQSLTIWDVTTPYHVRNLETKQNGSVFSVRMFTDTLREFIAFDGASFNTPSFTGAVINQNLHNLEDVDYVMITYPDFSDQAERLAEFHRTHSGLNVFVTTPETVYNEFSSGVQDISGIRDFMRMLYNKTSSAHHIKYLLLLGDASYDYKNRVDGNTNFIPSYQSRESLDPIDSYVSDDYYGLVKGGRSADSIYIGIGRFPIRTAGDAMNAVDKVIHYSNNSDSVKSDWRNVVTFVADDQDNGGGNSFMTDADYLAAMVNKAWNVDKIYLDAYTQISTPGGARYPEVNDAINKRIAKGTLLINYIGHGGELGWAHERVLEVPDIQNWTNYNKLPVFLTGTCEFSRMDDPARISAGEYVFLNPKGGGIALFTTTRATFSGGNRDLMAGFYSHLFEKTNGEYHRMGDLIRLSKTNNDPNTRKFVLLGDPALMIAYPNLNVVTTLIKTGNPPAENDTLKALTQVTVEGEVREGVNLASDFNGTVLPTIYDKISTVTCKANDQEAPPYTFYIRKNIVYSGKSNVTNGKFSFTFIVPKDIDYKLGLGRISYYASSTSTDANGYDETIVVGGYDNNAQPDTTGPSLSLFMNDRNFISGGVCDQNPVLLADVYDESGINTVGNGIGHDITAILDDDTKNPMILNDYYVTGLDTYASGVIQYPMFKLADGSHHLDLKVWDVYNNSTQGGIDFIVASTASFALEEVMNYPNPFHSNTTFSFQTNQAGNDLEVEVRIYSLYGTLEKTLHTTMYSGGYRVEPFQWDGRSDSGVLLGAGTYVYRLTIVLPDGSTVAKSSKLVFIR